MLSEQSVQTLFYLELASIFFLFVIACYILPSSIVYMEIVVRITTYLKVLFFIHFLNQVLFIKTSIDYTCTIRDRLEITAFL